MKEHATEEHLNESILNEEILEDQKKNRIDHMTYLPGMEDPGSDIMDQVVEASKNFQQRALVITQAWNKGSYNLVNLNLNTNNYFPQPIMMRASMAKFSADEAAPAGRR